MDILSENLSSNLIIDKIKAFLCTYGFRDIMLEYSKQVMKLGNVLFELLSEALGLNPNYLNDMRCNEGLAAICNYYPSCP